MVQQRFFTGGSFTMVEQNPPGEPPSNRRIRTRAARTLVEPSLRTSAKNPCCLDREERAMRSVFHRFCLVLLVAGLVGSTAAWAQQTGTLAGVVRDVQGAVLPGVNVTVTSPALIGGGRSTPTGATGTYQLTGLPPG